MHPGGRIIGIKGQRAFDQAGGFGAVALFQPERTQQIKRRKNIGVDFQYLAIKLLGFCSSALLMQRHGLASQDM